MQQYIASKKVSFTAGASHVEMCVKHMEKITANQTHAHDDICLVGDTLVATWRGDVCIKDVVTGDYVITPLGLGKVTSSRKTCENARVISRFGLTGTITHPVFDGYNFKPLGSGDDRVKLDKMSFLGLVKWRYKKFVRENANTRKDRDRANLEGISRVGIRDDSVWSDFWSRKRLCTEWPYGFRGYRAVLRISCAMISILTRTTLEFTPLYIANRIKGLFCKGQKVRNSSDTLKDSGNPMYADVYNITVKDYGVYYANGILVSNCDTLYDGIKMGLIDKTLYIQQAGGGGTETTKALSESLKRKMIAKQRSYKR